MIKLNHARNKQNLDDVLNELDAFESELKAPAKPFTAFILDEGRQAEDPLIVHFETTSGANMHGDIETAYFYEMNCGNDDPDFENVDGADSIGAWWCYKGAMAIGVIAGHHKAVWTPDGICNAVYDDAFNLASVPATDADPFAETYRTAWISTAHIAPATLDGLNDITANRALPFWAHQTEYGWIIRFDALEEFGSMEAEGVAAHWISQQADIQEIKAMLFKHGYQAAHLDADGPVIEGLTEYDH